MIKLVDLQKQNEALRKELDHAINNVISSCRFIGGEEKVKFEEEFAAFCNASACASCGNGTDALFLALKCMGIGPGDEVITVSNTFIATSEAVSMTGAKPVFVDVLESTHLIDPDKIEPAITPATKAVIAVHLNGNVCDMDKINHIAKNHNLKVIEDAAQGHGGTYNGRKVGTLADAACFSFFPGKNLGAFGDAGAVVSNNTDFIGYVKAIANHGRKSKYAHDYEGVNSRMDTLQAAILRVKLKHLDKWVKQRQNVAQWYKKLLEGINDIRLLELTKGSECAYHLFPVKVKNRDSVFDAMQEAGVEVGIHYPIPLHEQNAYRHLGYKIDDLPVTHRVASELLSLPIYPELELKQVEFIVEELLKAVKG